MRPSHGSAIYNPIRASYTLRHGLRTRLFALVIGLHMPINHSLLFLPLIKTISLYDGFFLFCIIVMPIYAGLELLVKSYKQTFVITQDSITFNRVLFKPKRILWADVDKIYIYQRSILIKGKNGSKINISLLIEGISDFLKVVKTKLPETMTKFLFEQVKKYRFAP
jgi:hypothetical protein